MDNLNELKTARTSSKRKFTVLRKKLKNSIEYGKEDTKVIHQSLDEEYYKLFDIHLQIEEVSGEEDNYMEIVDKDYN